VRTASRIPGLTLASLFGCCSWLAAAQAAACDRAAPAPRLALALSGGGARGIAHIGALRALEEAGIPVDAIAGNSMGAVVGGVYAAGRSAAELEGIVRSVDWAELFSGRADRRTLPVARRRDRYGTLVGVDFDFKQGLRLPAGALAEHRVNRFLIEYLAAAGYAAEGDFDLLPIPFRAVATALDDGSRVILANGDLARAVRASMSIPVLFRPVDWKGRKLVDGLLVDNLPTDVARLFGAAVVVAVDVGSPPLKPDEYEDAVGVAAQVSNLLTGRRNADFAAEADVCVRPDLGKHKTTDYADFDTLIERGHAAMQEAIPEIRRKLAEAGFASPFAPRASRHSARTLEGTKIAEVAVRGNQRLSEGFLRRIFNLAIGPGYAMTKGLRAFDKVDALGSLDHSWMEFEPVADGVRVVLVVQEAPPNRIELGAAYTEWERARGTVRLSNYDTLGFGEETDLLLSASEAETLARLSLRGDRLFVAGLGYRLSADTGKDEPRFFDAASDSLGRARFDRSGVDARLQLPVKRWGLLEAGARFGRVKTHEWAGISLEGRTDDVGMLEAALTADNLDALLWPEAGQRLAVSADWNLPGLGATYDYWRLSTEGRLAQPLGRRGTLQVDALVSLSGGEVPVYDWFRIGGPYLVPGYHHEELKGPQAVAGAVSLRFRLLGPLRLVLRGGAGNVFASRAAIELGSLHWGVGAGAMVPTRLGPMALEVGVREGGDALLTVSLGWN
jgi:NTE family protein